MSVVIKQIHPVFVGEVSGVDLTQPLSSEVANQIEAALDEHAVLVFHNQAISDEQQQAFSQNFGELENAKGGNGEQQGPQNGTQGRLPQNFVS